jgi:hypothetical protein
MGNLRDPYKGRMRLFTKCLIELVTTSIIDISDTKYMF